MDAAPQILEALNARAMSPEQVAQSFVETPHYWPLRRSHNSLISGPRGSGKTTLLKMLAPRAVRAWNLGKEEHANSGLPFIGVYVGAEDLVYPRISQYAYLGISKQVAETLLAYRVISRVIEVLAEEMNVNAHDYGSLIHRPDQNRDLARTLCSGLSLNEDATDIAHIPMIIRRLCLELSNYLISMQLRNEASDPSIQLEVSRNLIDFGLAIDFVISAIESNIQSSLRWAILLDELELLPSNTQESVFRCLRSANSNVVFKIAISPYSQEATTLKSTLTASLGHDYEEVEIGSWQNDRHAREFCFNLANQTITKQLHTSIDAATLLGISSTEEAFSSHNKHALRELQDRDKTFKEFCLIRDIPIDTDETNSKRDQAYMRKILPIVHARLSYLSFNPKTGLRRRSGRNLQICAGIPDILRVTEGNPRLLIALVSSLALSVDDEERTQISEGTQSKEVSKTCRKLRAWLETLQGGPSPFGNTLQLVDAIGQFFRDALLSEHFNPDPPASFVVDPNVPRDLIPLIDMAAGAGALIHVGGGRGESNTLQRRFRLCHMLATYYSLPIRLGRSISLSTILKRYLSQSSDHQPTLFGDRPEALPQQSLTIDDVFVSYSREDEQVARQFVHALSRLGYRVWWDQYIPVGTSFRQEIEARLRRARCVVVLWTKNSVGSPFTVDEVNTALQCNKPLLPIMVENCSIPLGFQGIQALSMEGLSVSNLVAKLRTSLPEIERD